MRDECILARVLEPESNIGSSELLFARAPSDSSRWLEIPRCIETKIGLHPRRVKHAEIRLGACEVRHRMEIATRM
jgi:hypothetical protein